MPMYEGALCDMEEAQNLVAVSHSDDMYGVQIYITKEEHHGSARSKGSCGDSVRLKFQFFPQIGAGGAESLCKDRGGNTSPFPPQLDGEKWCGGGAHLAPSGNPTLRVCDRWHTCGNVQIGHARWNISGPHYYVRGTQVQ